MISIQIIFSINCYLYIYNAVMSRFFLSEVELGFVPSDETPNEVFVSFLFRAPEIGSLSLLRCSDLAIGSCALNLTTSVTIATTESL